MPPGVLAPVPVSCVVGSKSEVSLLGYDACPPEVASNLRDCCHCACCGYQVGTFVRGARGRPFWRSGTIVFFFSLLELMRFFLFLDRKYLK